MQTIACLCLCVADDVGLFEYYFRLVNVSRFISIIRFQSQFSPVLRLVRDGTGKTRELLKLLKPPNTNRFFVDIIK